MGLLIFNRGIYFPNKLYIFFGPHFSKSYFFPQSNVQIGGKYIYLKKLLLYFFKYQKLLLYFFKYMSLGKIKNWFEIKKSDLILELSMSLGICFLF